MAFNSMTDKIILELTLDELELIDKYVEYNEETKSVFDKIKYAYPQPKMTLENEGDYAVVSYNDTTYYRLMGEDATCFCWYIRKGVSANHPTPTLVMVTDAETERLLEGLYYNHIEVKKEKEPEDNEWKSVALRFGKEFFVSVGPCGYYDYSAEEWFEWVVNTYEKLCDDTVKLLKKENLKKAQERRERVHNEMEQLDQKKSPAEEAYKRVYGYYPNTEVDDYGRPYDMDWRPFRIGYNAAQEDYKVGEYQEPIPEKSPVEEAYKDWYGEYPPISSDADKRDIARWHGFQAAYEVSYAISTAKEVLEEVQEEPKESWMDKPIDELVDMLEKNPPDCLKFQLGKTLEQIIERWWCDVFTSKKYDWDMETAIQDLCDRVFLWLPKEQDNFGTQRMETEIAVEAYNDLLNKIKSKIHNKK